MRILSYHKRHGKALKGTGNSVGFGRGFDPDQNEPPTEAGVSYSQGLREIMISFIKYAMRYYTDAV
jgi:hypothetical protein